MNTSTRPYIDFAFLDSGTGGIPYMLELKEKSPQSRCIYLGDTLHFPYGEKSSEQILSCASSAVKLIVEKWNPRAIVVACNTISVTTLPELRSAFPSLPIVGTVPAIRLAARVTKNKRIGLLATNATVRHPYNQRLVSEFASDCQVFLRGDPDLVSFIEEKLFTSSMQERMDAVKPAVDFFAQNDCDTIILGCTHFTHIAKDIQAAAGKDVRVVDSREGVAKQALRVEQDAGLNIGGQKALDQISSFPDASFFVTSASAAQEEEYKTLCKNFGIPWGGII